MGKEADLKALVEAHAARGLGRQLRDATAAVGTRYGRGHGRDAACRWTSLPAGAQTRGRGALVPWMRDLRA